MPDVSTTKLTEAPGIGPSRADALRQSHGVSTIEDLLRFYPRKYIDRSEMTAIKDLSPDGEEHTVIADITGMKKVRSKSSGKERLEVYLTGRKGGRMKAVWFHGLGVRHALKKLDRAAFVGNVDKYGKLLSIAQPQFFEMEGDGLDVHFGRVVPFYPGGQLMEDAGLSKRVMRQSMWDLLGEIPEEDFPLVVPPEIEEKYDLMYGPDAMHAIHFPHSFEELEKAEERIIFEELFLLQALMAQLRSQRGEAPCLDDGAPKETTLVDQFIDGLPFKLTRAQSKAIGDIEDDTRDGWQMNRLVQGDVGSGKTVVAVAAMLHAVQNGYQAAFMAPTELLAEQHYANLKEYLEPLGIEPVLLTGSMSKKDQTYARNQLHTGERDVAVGTHALISDSSAFDHLGLAVIDEQHRFGVEQRQEMFEKGQNTHMLLMTATPIPRSLAMTLYGDLDVTIMDEMPAGRKPVDTYWNVDAERPDIYDFVQRRINEGEQVYVVCPLVEENEESDQDLRDAESHSEEMSRVLDADVQLVHGQMSADEKEAAMDRFARGEADVLVATTVIEVGVDVEKATVMMIEHANRFGLSQLHQLRGRVGRSDQQSYCILMTEDEDVTEDAEHRLFAMVDHTDGFVISEIDMEIRGTGDFMDTRQSGAPNMILADLTRDEDLLQIAREAATELVQEDPTLLSHPSLDEKIRRRYRGHRTELATIG